MSSHQPRAAKSPVPGRKLPSRAVAMLAHVLCRQCLETVQAVLERWCRCCFLVSKRHSREVWLVGPGFGEKNRAEPSASIYGWNGPVPPGRLQSEGPPTRLGFLAWALVVKQTDLSWGETPSKWRRVLSTPAPASMCIRTNAVSVRGNRQAVSRSAGKHLELLKMTKMAQLLAPLSLPGRPRPVVERSRAIAELGGR